jgi:nucleotide-binding universal stress UspA family protein
MTHVVGPVVVGVDGSTNSRRALVRAGHHAEVIGAPLVVVHAVGLTDMVDGERIATFGHRADIEQEVDRWCDALREAGCTDFEARLLDGPPVDVLLRVAGDVEASTIVVGRRGSGGRPELLLGSTAHQVIERAHCPVLVIPPIGPSERAGDAAS